MGLCWEPGTNTLRMAIISLLSDVSGGLRGLIASFSDVGGSAIAGSELTEEFVKMLSYREAKSASPSL